MSSDSRPLKFLFFHHELYVFLSKVKTFTGSPTKITLHLQKYYMNTFMENLTKIFREKSWLFSSTEF